MSAGLSGQIARARRLAQKRGHTLTTAHVLLALFQGDEQVAGLLARRGISEVSLHEAVAQSDEEPQLAVELAMERAGKVAQTMGAEEASRLHLLLAIVRESRSAGYRCLQRLGGAPEILREETLATIQHGSPRSVGSQPRSFNYERPVAPRPNVRRTRRRPGECQVTLAAETESKLSRRGQPQVRADETPLRVPTQPAEGPVAELETAPPVEERPAAKFVLDADEYPLLSALGRNLTALAADGAFDPVIGRDREIELLLDVLSRRRGNNPLLVGPAGVGKTAIVEGLARVLSGVAQTGDAVGGLEGRILVELSPGALLSGTGVRGALSERVAALREEVAKSAGQIILFLDEIHMIVGSGDGPDSLGNELKTALSRGELPCIGATTDAEFRRTFERDAALARRFTRLDVEEPSPEAAEAILRGVSRCYELHHTVAVSRPALKAAVGLSVRFLAEGHLPDKAIGVLDQAAARVRRRGGTSVDVDAIAEVVAERSGVPAERLLQRDGDVLLGLEQCLAERVQGQGAAIEAIASSLRRSAVGFSGRRPLGTFLFLGTTGVGKTEMAKAINELLFPGTEMVRIDMSELSEPHSVARLLGAPPGYVGHDDGGQLTEPVRRRPYSLVLLDEVEKAHPDVLLSLLPLLDEGRVTDGRGRLVDFTNTVIVMTSNLGALAPKNKRSAIGFADSVSSAQDTAEQAVLGAARAALPPELWNRIDEPLYFRPLSRSDVGSIARLLLNDAIDTAAEQYDVELTIDDSAIDALIAAGGFDPDLGARPMRRVISRSVEALLASALLSGELPRGSRAVLRGQGDRVVLDPYAVDAAE